MSVSEFFNKRKIAIATKHNKEKVIKPLFQKAFLGSEYVVPENFDTDTFGTFTRDVKRTGDQLEAARKKALEAMKITGFDVAVASEGSFDAHPSMPFATSNLELVLLVDAKHNVEVRGHSRTFETNMAHAYVSSLAEANAFARSAGFPEHGVIVRESEDSKKMFKEIKTWDEFERVCKDMLEQSNNTKIFLETDMRAHRNPTRMKNIERAVMDLITHMQSTCPACGMFGFVPVKAVGCLVCDTCGSTTDIPGKYLYECQKCNYSEEQWIDEKTSISREQCQYCNP